MMMNISLDTVKSNAVNISTLDFRIRQHFNSNWTSPKWQKLVNVPEVPVVQLYKHMINTGAPVHSFTIRNDYKNPSLTWTILMHPGTYIGTIGMIFMLCVAVYCFKDSGSGLSPLGGDLLPQPLQDIP